MAKFRVHTHIHNYGVVDDIITARAIAKMAIEEDNKKEVFIEDAETEERIETIKRDEK